MTEWGDISAAEYAEIEQRFIATMAKQQQRWRRQQLDAIDTELARRSVQKAFCDGLSGHVKPEATVQSPASEIRESAMMKDFDHVAEAQLIEYTPPSEATLGLLQQISDASKVALCGMRSGVQLADSKDALALAEAEITRLHSIIGHMASQISALLTAHPSEPDAATGAIPATAATQGGPVTADPAPMPFNALRWTR